MIECNYGENWKQLSDECKKRDNYKCQRCGRDFSKEKFKIHAHHKIPLSQGGRNCLANLITLCEDCHSKTHNKDIHDKFHRKKRQFNF